MKKTLGNVFATEHPILVHGCNAQGVMGSGVAKQVADKWPEAFESYTTFLKSRVGQRPALGRINPVPVQKRDTNIRYVINAITQLEFGRDPNIRYVSYDAVDDAMRQVALYAESLNIDGIAMPQIGAGLGNGHWPVIENIIYSRLSRFHVTIYLWAQEK